MSASDPVRLLFLDIDGVLNSTNHLLALSKKRVGHPPTKEERKTISRLVPLRDARIDIDEIQARRMILNDLRQLDPEAVKLLNVIVKEGGAKIVVSSVWRIWYQVEGLQALLASRGLQGEVIGRTPRLDSNQRGEEIQHWIEKSGLNVESFVAIDDDSADMGLVMDRLVKTQFKTGLLQEHIEKAIGILNRPI